MAVISHLRVNKSNKSSAKSSAAISSQYGRVTHIILDINDPKCKDASMINGAYYRVPGKGANEENTSALSFAYQGNTTIRILPMVGEIIQIESKPAAGGVTSKYWTGIVPIWNHPHHNASPDTKQPEWRDSILGGVKEQATINPLQANPGDTIIEGRLGQSIRFGGNKGPLSGIIEESNDGKPVVIVSNGQIDTTNGNDLIQEDVNKDFNSIYLVSDHKVPIDSSNSKRDSYNDIPTSSSKYKGNQVVINGGRLFFNAKEESAFISAKSSIGLNANTLNFDAKEYFCVDADSIFLGKKARTSKKAQREPVLLGKQMENWLKILISSLNAVASAMTTASALGIPVTQLNTAGPSLQASLTSLQKQISIFQSKKVFTE